MALNSKILGTSLLICIIALTIYVHESEARRGGGARFGGRFRSGYRSSYRSTSVRYGSSYRSTRIYHTAAAAGMIYGYHRYTTSRRYHSHPDREPTICINRYDNLMNNGTNYVYFICPKYMQGEDYTYCCGPKDRQECCRFWDNGARVFGVVTGIVIFITIIVLICYCCCFRKKKSMGREFIQSRRRQPPSGKGPSYAMTSTGPPVSGSVVNGTQPLYPPQPMPFTDGQAGMHYDPNALPPGPVPSYPQPGEGGAPPPMAPYSPPGQQDGYPPPGPGYGPYPPVESKDGMAYPPAPPDGTPYPLGPPGGDQYPRGPPPGPFYPSAPGEGGYPPPGGQAPYPPPNAPPYPTTAPPPYGAQ